MIKYYMAQSENICFAIAPEYTFFNIFKKLSDTFTYIGKAKALKWVPRKSS